MARNSQRASAKVDASRSITFKECVASFIADHEAEWKNPVHRQQWKNTLLHYAYPHIGAVPLADVGTNAVLKVGRDRIVRDTTVATARCRPRPHRPAASSAPAGVGL